MEITRESISNGDWEDILLRKSGFSIYKLTVPGIIVQDPNIDGFELKKIVSNYDVDYGNSFSCLTKKGFKLDKLDKDELIKIFFDRAQKGIYWSPYELGEGYRIRQKIQRLEISSWYRFDGLREHWTFYAYVDLKGKVHVFHTTASSFGV